MSDDATEDTGSSIAAYQKFYENYGTLDLIRSLAKLREQKDAMEDELKGINAEHRYLAEIAVPEHFAAEGIKNMNVEGLGRVGLRADIYASIKAGKKDAAYEWLSDIGSSSLIQPSVPPSTLKAFLKNRMKGGDEIPEELFNVNAYQLATITKG